MALEQYDPADPYAFLQQLAGDEDAMDTLSFARAGSTIKPTTQTPPAYPPIAKFGQGPIPTEIAGPAGPDPTLPNSVTGGALPQGNPLENAPSPQAPPDQDVGFKVPGAASLKPPSKAEQAAQVHAMQANGDLTQLSQAGIVPKTREDMAREAGGVAATEEQAAVAELEAQREARALQGQKDAALAGELQQHAKELALAHVDIENKARQRADRRQKMIDDDAKNIIDPSRAWANTSGFSKAMWMVSFLAASQTKNATANIGMVLGQLNRMVDQDVMAQKANAAHRQETIGAQAALDKEQDKLDADHVGHMVQEYALRYNAIDKALDSQIAAIGRPAAERAGLLKAKVAIQQELLKGRSSLQEQAFKEAESGKERANRVYLKRLDMSLEKYKADQSDKLARDKLAKEHPTQMIGTVNTGLQATAVNDKGETVQLSQIPLRQGTTADQAAKANQIVTTANSEATALREVQKDLEGMSSTDIQAGGTPEYRQHVYEYMAAKLRAMGGTAQTQQETANIMASDFGFNLQPGKGFFEAGVEALKMKAAGGDIKEGVSKAIDNRLSNIDKTTLNDLQPYLDPDASNKLNLKFNPQSTHNEKARGSQSTDEAAIKAAGSGDAVLSGKKPGSLESLTKDVPDIHHVDANLVKAYDAMKAAGRGQPGGLPVLKSADEEKAVREAGSNFEKKGAESIAHLVQSYQNNPELSKEAKLEITVAGKKAFSEAVEKETELAPSIRKAFSHSDGVLDAVKTAAKQSPNDELLKAIVEADKLGADGRTANLTAKAIDNIDKYPALKSAWEAFQDSPEVRALRTNAGLNE